MRNKLTRLDNVNIKTNVDKKRWTRVGNVIIKTNMDKKKDEQIQITKIMMTILDDIVIQQM